LLQVTQPIWLWAGTAVMIPLLLHLWNVRQGKVLKVGSIELLQQHARQASLSRRFTEIPLLLLRCLLLLLVALLLANPLWQQRGATHKKGWILLAHPYGEQTYLHFKPAIDSLLRQGFQLRYFDNGFAATDTGHFFINRGQYEGEQHGDYWPLLPQLAEAVPPGTPVYIYTVNELRHFTGARPVLPENVQWFTFTPAGKSRQYITQAWLLPGSNHPTARGEDTSIRVVLAHSAPAALTYTYHTIPCTEGVHDSFKVQRHEGKWEVERGPYSRVIADTAVCRIALYTGDNPLDAKYIQAAIAAMQTTLPHPIQLTAFNSTAPEPQHYQWLLWLSAKPVPAALQAEKVLTYHNGPTHTAATVLQTNYPMQPVTLRQYNIVNTPEDSLHVLWRNGQGQPVLYSEYTRPHYYLLATRFSPAWNTLTWNTAFPALLAQLLLNDGAAADATSREDIRIADSIQLQPQPHTGATTTAAQRSATPLSQVCWLLILIVLLCERILAYKNKGGTYA